MRIDFDADDHVATELTSIAKLMFNEDHIGVVLRSSFHLETLLDHWLISKTGADLFEGLLTSNEMRVGVCKNLGFPDILVTPIKKIFKIRNDLAHNNSGEEITHRHISALEDMLNNISPTTGNRYKNPRYGVAFYHDDDTVDRHYYKDSDNRIRFIILFGQIYATVWEQLFRPRSDV
ncbi:hypothetical protein [Salinicola sp. CPA57]|uniref:hypothetical protein n=1 Tax=Salinicola sp. CPA57 TaxID=1949080 RepID=UPI001300B5F2|nr:hypothetical protein [Salinicola sp. CPA57]